MITTGRLKEEVLKQAKTAKRASRFLASISTEDKNNALLRMADTLEKEKTSIFQANELDVNNAHAQGIPKAKIERLLITEQRLQEMIEGLRQLVSLPDPVGEVLDTRKRPNGMIVEKRRVPFGLIAMIYESRPNVTVDAVGLAIKTGNAIILRGGKEAIQSNLALVRALTEALKQTDIPSESIQFIQQLDRETVDILIQAKGIVDLAIPRGGAGLIQRVVQRAFVPVIETGVGNCHVYIHQSADPEMAKKIAVNAKTQRPSVCNAAETLLIDQAFAQSHLVSLLQLLREKGVEIRGCEKTRELGKSVNVIAATDEDYETEHLDLILTVKIVSGVDEAIDHIEQYGTKHSEAIVAEDQTAIDTFLDQVDAATVYHNVSTRYTDGFEFGFGAEIGISTQKLHARGPMGLPELTSYKYVVTGSGQIR